MHVKKGADPGHPIFSGRHCSLQLAFRESVKTRSFTPEAISSRQGHEMWSRIQWRVERGGRGRPPRASTCRLYRKRVSH